MRGFASRRATAINWCLRVRSSRLKGHILVKSIRASRSLNSFAVALSLLLAMAGHAPVHADEAALKRGSDIAHQHCSRCHVIPGLRNMGIGSTPSFKIMVKSSSKNWRGKFEAFFSLAPHPAFVTIKELRTQRRGPPIAAPIVLSVRELDDLMVYVDNLAAEFRSE